MKDHDDILFERYQSGDLDLEEKGEMARRLDTDEDFRAAFVSYIEETQDLACIAQDDENFLPVSNPGHSRGPWRMASIVAGSIAASIAIILVLQKKPWHQKADDLPGTPRTIGRIVEGEAPVFSLSGIRFKVGDRVPEATPMTLQSGTAIVRLDGGGLISLQAATAVEFIDPSTVKLVKGTLSGEVSSPEIELNVITPSMVIRDMGTKFGVIALDKFSEVHVLEGMVEINSHQEQYEILVEGQAMRLGNEPDAKPVSIPQQSDHFPSLLAPTTANVSGGDVSIDFDSHESYHRNFVALSPETELLQRDPAGYLRLGAVPRPRDNVGVTLMYNPGENIEEHSDTRYSFNRKRTLYGGDHDRGAFSVQIDVQYKIFGNASAGFYTKVPIGEGGSPLAVFRILNSKSADFRLFNPGVFTPSTTTGSASGLPQLYSAKEAFLEDAWYTFRLVVTDTEAGEVSFVGSISHQNGPLIHQFDEVFSQNLMGPGQVCLRVQNNTPRPFFLDNFELKRIHDK